MEVILLERIPRLGQMGEIVRVRDGFARNFLLPQGKALRATAGNRTRFDSERAQLEARNLERKAEAEGVAAQLNGLTFVIIRQAGETGVLYGSVSTRDLADTITAGGISVGRNQVQLNQPIKAIGLHPVVISLHPEVEVTINANIARSEDEATRQSEGEDLTKVEQFELEPIEDEEGGSEGAESADEEAAG